MEENRRRTKYHRTVPAPGTIAPTPSWPRGSAEALIRMWNQGLAASQVAVRLGTSVRAVESKVRKLRVAGYPLAERRRPPPRRPRRARRTCLYCGHVFASTHVGNRLCPTCLEEGPFTSAML